MKRFAIAAALVAAPLALANAAGPFDGNYTGGSPGMGRQGCPATTASVSIVDGKVSGRYQAGPYSFPISGAVAADGAVTGKWSAYALTGTISGGHFTGSYISKECGGARPIELNKSG
jgi:hypothetical protein